MKKPFPHAFVKNNRRQLTHIEMVQHALGLQKAMLTPKSMCMPRVLQKLRKDLREPWSLIFHHTDALHKQEMEAKAELPTAYLSIESTNKVP